jgi:hypothetical protein
VIGLICQVYRILDERPVPVATKYLDSWIGFNKSQYSCEPAEYLSCPDLPIFNRDGTKVDAKGKYPLFGIVSIYLPFSGLFDRAVPSIIKFI